MKIFLQVRVAVSNISGERFWDIDTQMPPNIQIAVNINVLGLDEKGDNRLIGSFLVAAQYTPSVGQLTAKGKVIVDGKKEELGDLRRDIEQHKPPMVLLQSINSFVMGELIVISKVVGIPPPLPPLVPAEGRIAGSMGPVVI